jgi:hypothetical protein
MDKIMAAIMAALALQGVAIVVQQARANCGRQRPGSRPRFQTETLPVGHQPVRKKPAVWLSEQNLNRLTEDVALIIGHGASARNEPLRATPTYALLQAQRPL